MAETLLFTVPQPEQGQASISEILWYQSDSGVTWDITPVDIISVTALPIDNQTGKYTWNSLLANENRWHNLRTRNALGEDSITGIKIPPRPPQDTSSFLSDLGAVQIESGKTVYKLGDTVDLMIQLDESIATLLGLTLSVRILDPYNSILATLTADYIGNGLYVAEYIIPRLLDNIYDVYKQSSPDDEYYELIDEWVFPDSSITKFNFFVKRGKTEQVVVNNTIFELLISDIVATDNSVLPSTKIRFTSNLSPFYCSIDDAIDVHKEYMSIQDHFDIVDQIVDFSKNLDMHLKPDVITYPERFLNAAKNWVAYTVAYNFLSAGPLDITSESKSLNNFSVSKTYDRDMHSGIHRNIREYLDYFQNIVLAGGNDTPFTTKTFIKGVFDLKRPRTNRSSLDISDFYPWVNTSTSNTVITLADGRAVEVEGTRTIGFRMRLGSYGGGLSVSGTSLNSHATFNSQGSWSEQQETMY